MSEIKMSINFENDIEKMFTVKSSNKELRAYLTIPWWRRRETAEARQLLDSIECKDWTMGMGMGMGTGTGTGTGTAPDISETTEISQWVSCDEILPDDPGLYMGAVDWDDGATAERWFDGDDWWNCNIDPSDVDYDDDIVWTVPITHWRKSPDYRDTFI